APSTTVLTALPATAVTHRLLVLPFRDPRRLARTVRLELFGQLPDEPEDALVAYESLGRVREGSAVLAVGAPPADLAAPPARRRPGARDGARGRDPCHRRTACPGRRGPAGRLRRLRRRRRPRRGCRLARAEASPAGRG